MEVVKKEVLWQCDQHWLINTIWWQFIQHFGWRRRQEHHSRKLEDLSLKRDDNSVEYLRFVEGITKTRQFGLYEKHRLVSAKDVCCKHCTMPHFIL